MEELKKFYAELLAPIHAAIGKVDATEKDASRAGKAALAGLGHLLANVHRIADALEKIAEREVQFVEGELAQLDPGLFKPAEPTDPPADPPAQ